MSKFISDGFYLDYLYFILLYLAILLIFSVVLFLRNFLQKKACRIIQHKFINLLITIFMSFVFSMFGLTIGLVSGMSRNPIMDIVITSLLTFIAGYNIYIFSNKALTAKISALIIILSISSGTLIGALSGAKQRMLAEATEKKYELEVYKYKAKIDLILNDNNGK